MKTIQLHDKTFVPYISANDINEYVVQIATIINGKQFQKPPIFIGVLNGSFMFCSDLMKEIQQACEVQFVKLQSYVDTQSTGIVNEIIGLTIDVQDRDIIVVEDIVDTGNTLVKIMDLLKPMNPKSITIATLFLKPTVYKKSYKINIVGKEIPNHFIVGYGLDYNGLGRNLKDVYILS